MGEQTCSSKAPKLPGCGLLEFPGLCHPHGIPQEGKEAALARGSSHLPCPTAPITAASSGLHLPGLRTF